MTRLINVEVPVSLGPLTFGSFPMDLEDERSLSEIAPFVAKMMGVDPATIPTRRWQVQAGTGMDDFGFVVGDPLDATKTLRAQGIHGVRPAAGASSFPGPNDFAPTIRLVDLDDPNFIVAYPNNPFGEVTLPDRTPLS